VPQRERRTKMDIGWTELEGNVRRRHAAKSLRVVTIQSSLEGSNAGTFWVNYGPIVHEEDVAVH
jgi:hypothetical protein